MQQLDERRTGPPGVSAYFWLDNQSALKTTFDQLIGDDNNTSVRLRLDFRHSTGTFFAAMKALLLSRMGLLGLGEIIESTAAELI